MKVYLAALYRKVQQVIYYKGYYSSSQFFIVHNHDATVAAQPVIFANTSIITKNN